MFNDDNNDSGNVGIFSKFRERIRNIRINRYKKKVDILDNGNKDIQDVLKKIDNDKEEKVFLRPKVISKRRRVKKAREENVYDKGIDKYREDFILDKKGVKKKEFLDDIDKRVDIKNDLDGKKNNINGNNDLESLIKDDISCDKLDYDLLGKKIKIIKRIKNDFNKKLAELDVLESEIYYLDQDVRESVDIQEIKKIKREIDKKIEKINKIIDEYNIYSDNYELENIISLSDGFLIDDIIEYKGMVESYRDRVSLVREYKLLNEFRDLYMELDHIKGMVDDTIVKVNSKASYINSRDNEHSRIIRDAVMAEDVVNKCNVEIEKQNEYLNDLILKIDKIDELKYTEYKIKGINGLLGQSIKYLSLLLLKPFSGIIPGIAVETIATRKMIKNIKNNMEVNVVEKIKYEAYDYESELSNKINDLDYTYSMIDDTIDLVYRMKNDFMKIYNPRIKGGADTLRKLDDISDRLANNRYKLDIVKKRLNDNRKINKNKMIKVKKLN